jgi:hypothetical protein
MEAAGAVSKDGDQSKSMIREGLIVPVGRVLVVLSPNAVPSLDSLEKYDLHNVLGYESTTSADPNNIPQDLVYNPQKDYWARCGHDLDIKPGAIAAFRDGDSPRLWVVQPDGDTHTLAVGSESLFARDYVLNFPTETLFQYFDKKRKFTIKHQTALGPIEEKYRKFGIADVDVSGPREVSTLPSRGQTQFDVDIGYNELSPAPVTLQLQLARRPESRADVDHLLAVTFSGTDLSTVTSSVRRVSATGDKISNDEVFGSRTQHSANSISIEVPRPPRFDEQIKFVMVNASSHFRIKTSLMSPRPKYVLSTAYILIDQNQSDFTLEFEGRVKAEGVIGVNFNFAMPHGIEVSPGSQPQTKLVRLNTDNVQRIEIALVKLLLPGDQPLKLPAAEDPIEPLKDGPVYVCQLDYKL